MFWHHWNSSVGNTDLLFYGLNSWCLNSRLSTGWIISWRLVPERREMIGLQASQLLSTSYRQLMEGRWHVRKVLLSLSCKTSTWGKPVFPHTHFHCFIVSSSISSLFFTAKCWTLCMTFTVASSWTTMWSRATCTATVSQVNHPPFPHSDFLLKEVIPCMMVYIIKNVDHIKSNKNNYNFNSEILRHCVKWK